VKPTGRPLTFGRALLACLSSIILATCAYARTQGWDTKRRETSQRLVSVAHTELASRQVDEAISTLVRAAAVDPTDPLPCRVMALALAMKGRFQEAYESLNKSLELDSSATETVLSAGIVSYLGHDYRKALSAFRKIVEVNPDFCYIYINAGYVLVREGKLERAEKCFKKAIECYPTSQAAYEGLAFSRYLAGRLAGARDAGQQAGAIASYPPLTLLIANIDQLEGKERSALRGAHLYSRQIKKGFAARSMTAIGYPLPHDFHWDPYLADRYDNGYLLESRMLPLPKGAGKQRSLCRKGKFEEAEGIISAAMAQHPDDHFLNYQLALAELSCGRYADSQMHFKRALKGCPSCNVYRLYLARALALAGKERLAAVQVQAFLELMPAQRVSPYFTELARQAEAAEKPAEVEQSLSPEPARRQGQAASGRRESGKRSGSSGGAPGSAPKRPGEEF